MYHESFKVTRIALLFSLSDLSHLIVVDSFIYKKELESHAKVKYSLF